MPKKKTHEQFIDELSKINSNIKILGEYINTNTKISCKCLIDDYEWYTTPHLLLGKVGCPKCGGTMKKSSTDFIKELYKINPNIKLLTDYINSKSTLTCECLIDSHIWNSLPQNLLKGHGCPKCSSKKTSERISKSHNDFVFDIKQISPNIQVLNTYKNNKSKIKCLCKICGTVWATSASNLINKKGCPKCAIEKIKLSLTKSHAQFIKEIKNINNNIEIIGTYINSNTKILCECKIDGYNWSALPLNLLRGTGCPICQKSHGETLISNILDKLNIDYIIQYRFKDCKNNRTLPFDFYLPNYCICIEYDGEQHFRPVKFGGCSEKQALQQFKQTNRNDIIKNKFCQNNNINLIRIKYSDYKDIENIIKNKLSLT